MRGFLLLGFLLSSKCFGFFFHLRSFFPVLFLYTESFFVHNHSFDIVLWFTAIMIKSAFRAKQFAFPAVQRRAAIDAIIPIVSFRNNLDFFNLKIQQ